MGMNDMNAHLMFPATSERPQHRTELWSSTPDSLKRFVCKYLPRELIEGCDWGTLKKLHCETSTSLARPLSHYLLSVDYLGQPILLRFILRACMENGETLRVLFERGVEVQGSSGNGGAGHNTLPCYPILIE